MRKGGGDQFCPVFERRLRKLVQVPLYISENGIDEVTGLGSHGVFRNFNSFVQGCVVGSPTHIGQLIKAEPENIFQHEIGRASCRERVEISEDVVSLEQRET